MLYQKVLPCLTSLLFASTAFGKNLRYADMSQDARKQFLAGQSEDTCEFRQGDLLDVKLRVNGDILQSTASPSTRLVVKRGFFLKIQAKDVMMSWDGHDYRPFPDLIKGQFGANVSDAGGSVAQVLFQVDAYANE